MAEFGLFAVFLFPTYGIATMPSQITETFITREACTLFATQFSKQTGENYRCLEVPKKGNK